MARKARIVDGYYKDPNHRSVKDERSGIVIDISQGGRDDEPITYIEVYPYATGHQAVSLPMPTDVRNPWYAFISTPRDEGNA